MRDISSVFVASCLALAACGGGASSTTSPSRLTVTVPTVPLPSGTSVQAVATVTNGSGGSSPATNVAWSSSNPNVASVTSTGLVTGALTGSTTLTATAGSLTGQLNIGVIAGEPNRIVIVAGNGQTAAKGSVLPDPPCTSVLDAAGNFIVGVTVNYSVATGGGSLASPTSPPTDGGGISVAGHWTLGPVVGQQTVTATSSVGRVTFTANAQ